MDGLLNREVLITTFETGEVIEQWLKEPTTLGQILKEFFLPQRPQI